MKKTTFFTIIASLLFSTSIFAQVGVGTTTPNGALDVNSATDGMLIPRVALTATNAVTPLTAPTNSELVYNTATAGVAPNNVTPGFYYWDTASLRWIRILTGANNDWTTTGNAGTVAATNFVGTTDNIPLRFRTTNIERFEILSGGPGTESRIHSMTSGTAAIPNYSWNANTGMGFFRAGSNILGVSTAGTERMRVRADGNIAINGLGNATDRLSVDDADYPINGYGTGTAANHTAIYGSQAGTGAVIWGENFKAVSDNTAAVFGESEATRDPGIEGRNNFANNNSVGVLGLYNITGNTDGTGVFGNSAASSSGPGYGYGVRGQGNWYGVFAQGDLGATGAKTFLIDHPLDPENKSLKHFSVESNEILNVYRGNGVFDAAGNAKIKLPEYFTSINKNFTYQLTPVGAAMPNLFIGEKINSNGEFTVSGGIAGKEVSWTVYAERNDKYLQQNPEKRASELDKKPHEKGKYWDAKSWNKPETDGILHTPYNKNMTKNKN